eukprot:scaffold70929_cov69-Phaeocystis_antarctica.AAC.2
MLDHAGGGGGPQKPSPPQPLLTLFHLCRSKISSLAEVFSASPLDASSVPAALPVLRQPAAARGDHAATGSEKCTSFLAVAPSTRRGRRHTERV